MDLFDNSIVPDDSPQSLKVGEFAKLIWPYVLKLAFRARAGTLWNSRPAAISAAAADSTCAMTRCFGMRFRLPCLVGATRLTARISVVFHNKSIGANAAPQADTIVFAPALEMLTLTQ